MGAVRDAKGKAVATVFAELGNEQKAEVCIDRYLGPRFAAHDIVNLPLCRSSKL